MNTPRHSPNTQNTSPIRLQLSNPGTNPKVVFLSGGQKKNIEKIFSPSPKEYQEMSTYINAWYLCIGIRTNGEDYPQYMKDFFHEYEEYISSGQEKTILRENGNESFILVPVKNQTISSQSQQVSRDIMEIIGMSQKKMEENTIQNADDVIPPSAQEMLADMDPDSTKNILQDINIK